MIEVPMIRRTVIDCVHEWRDAMDLVVLSCRHERLVPHGGAAVGSAIECPACQRLREDVKTT